MKTRHLIRRQFTLVGHQPPFDDDARRLGGERIEALLALVERRLTGIGRSKLYERMKAGAIPAIKVGSMILAPVKGLEGFLEKHLQEWVG